MNSHKGLGLFKTEGDSNSSEAALEADWALKPLVIARLLLIELLLRKLFGAGAVIAVIVSLAITGAIAVTGVVGTDATASTLTIHWRGCFHRGVPTKDPNGKWHRLCRRVQQDSLHYIDPKKKCCSERGHEAFITEGVPLGSVVLHKVVLNKAEPLSLATKRKIGSIGAQLSVAFNGSQSLVVR